MMVPEGSYTGQLVPPTALALDLSNVLSKGEGRIPSAMEIYDRIADLRCRLDVPATIDSDTYHGYSCEFLTCTLQKHCTSVTIFTALFHLF